MTSTKLLIVDESNNSNNNSNNNVKLTGQYKVTSNVCSTLSSSSTGGDDEDESFYDAIDSTNTNTNVNENLPDFRKGLRINVNLNDYENEKESTNKKTNNSDDEDDDSDAKTCFFDTVTSRHASDSSLFSPLSPVTFQSQSAYVFDDSESKKSILNEKMNLPEITLNNSPIKGNTNENHNNNSNANGIIEEEDEDEDDIDAELETAWSFWIDRCVKGTSKNEYEAGLKLLHTVKTVQTFWSVYNNIPDVSDLPNRYSYHLMRNTRRPLWEDKENSTGGLWKFKTKKEDTSVVWREVLLASIGEQLSDCVSPLDDIIGVSVGRREKEDIVQVWNLYANYESKASVCKKIQELVPDVKFSAIFYRPHSLIENYEQTNTFNSINSNSNSNNNPIKYSNNNNNSHSNNFNSLNTNTLNNSSHKTYHNQNSNYFSTNNNNNNNNLNHLNNNSKNFNNKTKQKYEMN